MLRIGVALAAILAIIVGLITLLIPNNCAERGYTVYPGHRGALSTNYVSYCKVPK